MPSTCCHPAPELRRDASLVGEHGRDPATLPLASVLALLGLTATMQVLYARRLQVLIGSVVKQRGAGVREPKLQAVLGDQLRLVGDRRPAP